MSTPIKREAGQEQPRPPPAPPQQQQQQRPTVDRPVIAAASAAAPPPPSQQQPQVIEPVRWKWMSVDSDLFPDVSVPVIMRGPSNEAYISVRITERTVLMRFQNELSAEAIAYGSLTSYPCTPAECDELNEINESYVDRLYGTERFDLATEKLVKWKEFMEFFAILKRTCRLRKMPPPPQTVQPNRAATNAPAIQPPTFPQFTAVNPNPALRVSSVANNSTIHATLRGASASVASPNRAAQQIPSIRTTTPPVNTTVFNPPNTNLIARPPQQEITPVVATTSSGYNVISTPNGYKVVPPSPSNLTQHHIASRSVSQPPSQSSPPPQQIQRLQAVNHHLQQLQEMQQLNHLQPRPNPMSAGLVSNQHFTHMFPQQQQQQQQQPMAPPPPSSSSPHHLIQLQHHINMQNIQKQQMIQHHLNQQQQMSQSPPNSAQFFPNPNQHTAANVSVIPPPYVASPHRSAPSSPRSHSNGPPSSSSPGALNPPPFNSFPHGYMQQQQHQSPQMSHSSTTMSSPPTGNSASQSIHQIRPHSVAASIYPPGHHQHHVSPSLYSFPHAHHPNAAPHLHHPHHPSPLLPPQISGYSPPQQQQQPSTLLPPPPPPSHASIYNQAAAQLQALQHQQNLNNPALRHHLMSNPTPPLTPSPNPNLVVAANPSSNTADQILRILGAQQQQQQQQLQQSHNYNQYANNNRIIAPQIQPQIRTTAQHDQRTTSNIIPQPSTTSANDKQINTSSADEDDIIWLGDDQPITKPTTSSTIVKKIEKTSAPVKSENKTVVMASNSNTSTNQQTQANTRTSTKDRGPINYLKINTVVVPFINLEREQAVRLFELIPGSTQFVSAYQLAITGVIPHDLIDDRDRLRANFKSLQMATVAQLDEINKLTRELLAAFNPDAGPRLFLEQLDPGDKRHFHLVNVIELMLAYSSAAMFVREMSLHDTTLAKFNEQSFNFRDVLQMRGGIIQVIAPSTDGQDTSIKILPFVEVGDLLLIKDSIRNYLEELVALRQTESNTDEPKINLSKLVIPMTEQSEEQRLILRTIAEFFQLLLVYVAIPTRISYKMTLINVKPLFSLFPDRLFIICRFTENFPIDWRASLENIKSNISTNSEGERINSNGNEGEQPIATPTATTTTTTTTTVRRSSRNERRDIDDANQMTIELTSSSSEDNNPPEVAAATTNNNQMTIELTSTSSDEDRRENADSSQQPPPMETDENKVTSTTTTLNVDVTNQQNTNTTTTIISPQPVTTTTTTTTTAATSRFESSVSLSPASIDSPEPTSQFVEKSSSSPPKSKATENTVKSGRTFSISILHQQQKEKEKEKEKEAAKTIKIVTVERFTEDELKIRPRRRCYSAIYVCRATNTSKDFADWFKAEKWPKVERRILNQHQQQQVSSSEEKGEVVSSPPPCDHYLRRVLHGANPWEVQQSVVNLIQGHNRLAKMYKEKEERERESVNKNKPRAASLASEPTSTEDMRPSITSTTNKETQKPPIKQPPESSKPSEMNWEETGGGSEEPESKTTAVTTTTPKQRGRKRFSSQQSSSTTSTTNANTKKRKRGSRRRFTVKTPKRRRASHETVSYMSRTTTATTRNNSTSESDTSSGGSLKDFIANDDELEYETAEEDLYSSFPDDNEQDEWATATIGKQGTQSSKGIVVTLRRKSKNNPPPPPPLKPNIACIQKDNDLYTSEDPAVDEREILKKMGIFKVAKITDKKLSVTQILAIQRQLKETSNGDGSKRQFAKKATSKTLLPLTKDTTITNNKRTVPAKKQTTTTTTTTTSPTTRQNQRKISTSTSTTTTTTTKQTSKVKSEPTTSRIEKPVSPGSAITISSSSSAASVKPTATTKTKTTSSATSLFHDEDSNSLPELAF